MKVFITGQNGFLGSHLSDALIAEGHIVEGNDNNICSTQDIARLNTDCRDFENMLGILKLFKPDVLVHTAATAAEGFSVFSPHFITANIAEASVATFSAAIAAGAKRIVTMSSMARYGIGNPPFKESDPTNPIDPYGRAKVYAEDQLRILCETHGVKWSILTPHNIVGTRQQITPYRNVISIFLNRLKLGLPVYIYGDGEQKRCFSPVSDCLHSIVKVVHGAGDGEVINIGPDDDEITINHALELCEDATGIKAQRIYLPPRPVTDTVREAFCSSDKARALLDYAPQQDLKSCIHEMSEAMIPVPFDYNFPVEIPSDKMPKTWKEKL